MHDESSTTLTISNTSSYPGQNMDKNTDLTKIKQYNENINNNESLNNHSGIKRSRETNSNNTNNDLKDTSSIEISVDESKKRNEFTSEIMDTNENLLQKSPENLFSGNYGTVNANNSEIASLMMLNKMKQHDELTHNHFHMRNMPPLMRSSSNASSASSASSTISTTSSSGISTSSSFNVNDSLSSLSSSTSSISLFNENHFKALIRSAAVAAQTSNTLQSPSPTISSNGNTQNSSGQTSGDEAGDTVRSRSSSLSESSTTSSSSSSTGSSYSNNLKNNENEFLNNFLSSSNGNSTAMNASLMKQLITSYQASITNSNGNGIKNSPSNINSNVNVDNAVDQTETHALPIPYHKEIGLNNNNNNHSPVSNRKLSFTSSSSTISTSLNSQQNEYFNKCVKAEDFKTKINENNSKQQQHQHQQQSIIPNGQSPNPTPCKVCGDEASGFHYGVDSCEGCKGFFRRCITQGMNHQCTNNQQCEMTPFSRNSCQFCRLKKCFAVGMSREASRLGRRPKRAKDEKESNAQNGGLLTSPFDNYSHNAFENSTITPETTPLKQSHNYTHGSFQQHQNNFLEPNTNNKDSNSTKTINNNNNLSNKPPNVNSLIKTEESNSVANLEFNNTANFATIQPPFKLDSFNENSKPIKTPVSKLEFSKKDDYDSHQYSKKNKSPTNTLSIDSTSNIVTEKQQEISVKSAPTPVSSVHSPQQQMLQIEMLTKLISISDRHTSIERTNELEFIRTSIIESHCQIWPTTFEKIRRRYSERPPTRASQSSLNNSTESLSKGSNAILDNFVEAMVPLIMNVVKYCKYIPGFNQILHTDQVQLLKQGSFEVICVNSFMLVDAQNKLMLTPDMEFLMDCNTIKMMPLGFFMSDVFELGIQVSPLKLTDAEIALFNAILIMNPDRGDLQDKDHIEEIQSTLLHVLYKHLKYCRPDGTDLYYKMLKLIPLVQEINRKHSEALNTVKMSQTPSANKAKTSPNNSADSNSRSTSN